MTRRLIENDIKPTARKKTKKKVIEFEIETNWELKNNIKKSHAMIYENNKKSEYFSLSTQALPLLSWEQNIKKMSNSWI